MQVGLTNTDREALRALQKQRRNEAGYGQATVYRYAQAFTAPGLAQYLAHARPGYWGLLTSAQLAHLCRQVNATLYTDVRAMRAWLETTYQVRYSGLTQLLHRLGFPYKRPHPRALPGRGAGQTAFPGVLASLEAQGEAGRALEFGQELTSLLTRNFPILDAQTTT